MKKYINVLITIIAISVTLVVFEIPDRINYAINGMASFNQNKYEETDTLMKNGIINIDLKMDSYVGNEMIIAELDNMELKITRIEYTGTGYRLDISSRGISNFNNGNIIVLDNVEDFEFESNCGKMIFQVSGHEALTKDTINYICDIYPENDDEVGNLPNLQCSFTIPKLTLRNYDRDKE